MTDLENLSLEAQLAELMRRADAEPGVADVRAAVARYSEPLSPDGEQYDVAAFLTAGTNAR